MEKTSPVIPEFEKKKDLFMFLQQEGFVVAASEGLVPAAYMQECAERTTTQIDWTNTLGYRVDLDFMPGFLQMTLNDLPEDFLGRFVALGVTDSEVDEDFVGSMSQQVSKEIGTLLKVRRDDFTTEPGVSYPQLNEYIHEVGLAPKNLINKNRSIYIAPVVEMEGKRTATFSISFYGHVSELLVPVLPIDEWLLDEKNFRKAVNKVSVSLNRADVPSQFPYFDNEEERQKQRMGWLETSKINTTLSNQLRNFIIFHFG